jgi:death-on-curing protein
MSKRKNIVIPNRNEMIKIHDYLVETHGGLEGQVSDPSYIEDFCKNYLSNKGIVPIISFLLSRLSKGHYFVDGNKRTAYFSGKLCALRNGYDFNGTSPEEVVDEMVRLADLPEKDSISYAEQLVKRDLVKSSCYLKNYSDFERLVLKNIAVSTKLSLL